MKIAIAGHARSLFPQIRAKYLIEQGHDVYFIGLPPHMNVDYAPQSGLHYIELKQRHSGLYINKLDTTLKVGQLTRRLKIDVLHIIDMCFSHAALFSGSRKVVFENNGSDVLVIPKRFLKTKLYYRFIYRLADGVIQDSAIAQEAGITCGATTHFNKVIELGIDTQVFNPNISRGVMKKKYGIPPERKVIFSPRSFSENYNIDQIIEAIALVKSEFPNVLGVFCGYTLTGENTFKALVREKKLHEHTLFLGRLDHENELPFLFADADLAVSIPTSDSLPGSVLEGMACGVPMIVSDIPWFKGIFDAGKDLLVVPPKSASQLAGRVRSILSKEVILDTPRISSKVSQKFGYKRTGQDLEAFYHSLFQGE